MIFTDMSPEDERKWADTMQMMMWQAPGFRHLFYKLLSTTHNNGGSKTTVLCSEDAGIACTDGKNIIVNPKKFFKFSLPERVFVTGHEIGHNMLRDVELLHRCSSLGYVPMTDGTRLPFDNHTMQKAMDARLNQLLIQSKIGKPPTKCDGDPCGHYDINVAPDASVLDVYKKYYKKKPDPEGNEECEEGDGQGDNPGGFDNLLPPGKSTGQNASQAAAERNDQQWAVETAAAKAIEEMAKGQGRMAAALKRMFEQILEPEINWLDHIETLINRTCGDGGYDWTQPDEWFAVMDIYSPKPTGCGAGFIVVWGDTSGSRSDSELASNMAELAGVLDDVRPQRLTVLWCDADISYIDEIADPLDLEHIKARGIGGRGGTSVQPVLDWITKQHATPDLFIGFTDGELSFPKEPNFPVIWASSTDRKYPWGQVVRVNKAKRT